MIRRRGRLPDSRRRGARLAACVVVFAAAVGSPGGGARAAEPIKPIPEDIGANAEKAALGRALFHDPRLSRDDTVSCASCHDLTNGGADGHKVSIGIEGQAGFINSPTVFNAGLNFKQFWDGRARTLEQQIDDPVQSPREMGACGRTSSPSSTRTRTIPSCSGHCIRTASAATASGTRWPNS